MLPNVTKDDDTIEVEGDQNIKEPRACEHGRCDLTEKNCSEVCLATTDTDMNPSVMGLTETNFEDPSS